MDEVTFPPSLLCGSHECGPYSVGDLGPNTHSLSRESPQEDLGGIPLIWRKDWGRACRGELRHCRPVHILCPGPTPQGGPMWTVPSPQKTLCLDVFFLLQLMFFSCGCHSMPKSCFSFSSIRLNAKQPLTYTPKSLPHLANHKKGSPQVSLIVGDNTLVFVLP